MRHREAGGNFLDTANFCTGGTSEKFVGEFIKGHRDSIVLEQPIEMMSVATQVCHLRLRAVRPKHDAPKEATPRMQEHAVVRPVRRRQKTCGGDEDGEAPVIKSSRISDVAPLASR